MTKPTLPDMIGERLAEAARNAPDTAPRAAALDADSQLARMVTRFAPHTRGPAAWTAGSIQLLGLDDLHRELGPVWEKFADTIHLAIENILSQSIGPKDVFARLGDDRYMVIFEKTDDDHAAEIMTQVTDHLRTTLLGENGAELIRVRSAIGRVRKSADGDVVFAEGKDDTPFSIDATQKREAYESVYAPIWNARHEVMSSYAYVPCIIRADGTERYEHDVLPAGHASADSLELDLKHLTHIAETMADLYKNKFTVQLVSQIHYESLDSAASREAVLRICREIPEHLRKFLMVQITGLPEHTPVTTFMQRVAPLKPFFGMLTVRAPSLKTETGYFRDLGISSVTYRLPENADPVKTVKRLKVLVNEGKAAHILVSAEYVPTRALAQALQEAGVWFITGKCLGAMQDYPRNMRRCTLENIAEEAARSR